MMDYDLSRLYVKTFYDPYNILSRFVWFHVVLQFCRKCRPLKYWRNEIHSRPSPLLWPRSFNSQNIGLLHRYRPLTEIPINNKIHICTSVLAINLKNMKIFISVSTPTTAGEIRNCKFSTPHASSTEQIKILFSIRFYQINSRPISRRSGGF